jgi:hypothetical protein
MNKLKNVWKYMVLLGIIGLMSTLLTVICLMPFYDLKEPLPYWVEIITKPSIFLTFMGGFLGLITHYKSIITEIKEIID